MLFILVFTRMNTFRQVRFINQLLFNKIKPPVSDITLQ
jgi:hypothetical protein